MARRVSKARSKKNNKTQRIKRKRSELFGVLIIGIALFAFLSVFTSSTGILGEYFKESLMGLFGICAYIVPVIILFAGIFTFLTNYKRTNKSKIMLTLLLLVFAFCFIHLLYLKSINSNNLTTFIIDSYIKGKEGKGSGTFFSPLVYLLYKLLGTSGSYLFLIVFTMIDLLLLTNLSLKQIGKDFYSKFSVRKKTKTDTGTMEKTHKRVAAKPFIGEIIPINEPVKKDIDELKPLKEVFNSKHNKGTKKESYDNIKVVNYDNKEDEYNGNKEYNRTGGQKKEDERGIQPSYSFPPLKLLKESKLSDEGRISEKRIRANAKLLEETLNSFGISAKVIQISRGPAITRYELQPAPGIKVSRIVNLADDIALNLAAPGIRIEAPIPGKAAVGVEVPNRDISIVLLREVLESSDFNNHQSKLAFALGMDVAGHAVIADISRMPHLLIAGATGSGKSVCINALITSILYKAMPDEVKLILIDPKVVELNHFNGIPHLLIPVVTDPKKASAALNWAVTEMTSRYKLFADKGVKDLERYNESVDGIEEKRLPQILVIIDELADLMMVAPGDVEDAICRLAQMARAAGIHLVIATQRPSVDVITGVIKANIPSRIAFAVSSQIDSRTILDMGGAEKLLGRGDMLFYPSGAAKPIRVQGCFVSESEVESIVEHIKQQQTEVKYDIDILEEIAVDQERNNNGKYDELLPEAIEIVLDAGQASISMLQRRLRIGYARAARLIDEMESRGIVSGFDGSKPRNILISKEDFEREFMGEL